MDTRALEASEIFDLNIDNKLFQLHTALPAIITAVDLDNQTIDAQVAIKLRINNSGYLSSTEYPILPKIPFFTLQNGDYAITVPPKIGDTCLLIFAERETDDFLQTGKISEPLTVGSRKHDINDGFAIVGFNPGISKIKDFDSEGIVIRSKDGKRKIHVGLDKINVESNDSSLFLTNEKIEAQIKNASISLSENNIETKLDSDDFLNNVIITSDGVTLNGKTINLAADTAINLSAKNINVLYDNSGQVKFDTKNSVDSSLSSVTISQHVGEVSGGLLSAEEIKSKYHGEYGRESLSLHHHRVITAPGITGLPYTTLPDTEESVEPMTEIESLQQQISGLSQRIAILENQLDKK